MNKKAEQAAYNYRLPALHLPGSYLAVKLTGIVLSKLSTNSPV